MTRILFWSFDEEVTLEQEGFRFRNDDGDEASATWKTSQDVNSTIHPQENFRLRFLINATGNPAGQQFKVQYRKVGEETWTDIPVE